MSIRPVTIDDAPAIAAIYNHYIAHSIATFDEVAVPVAQIAAKIESQPQGYPMLVYGEDAQVVAYALGRPHHERSAYRYSAEVGVYVHPDYTRRGIGRSLYGELIPLLHAQGMHTLLGGISLPNPASVALHESMGFHKIAHYREVGYKFGQWIDVGYWQRML